MSYVQDIFARVGQGLVSKPSKASIPVYVVSKDGYAAWRKALPESAKKWLDALGFKERSGRVALYPGETGAAEGAVMIAPQDADPFSYAVLPGALPEGRFHFASLPDGHADAAALGWILASYRFERYRKASETKQFLAWPAGADVATVTRLAEAIFLVRDMITTPANDMGPEHLEEVAMNLGKKHNAKLRVVTGDELLKKGYPTIHAVGRASSRAPRFIELTWGKKDAPHVTLVGKGVCFDSGGLDLKPSAGMLLMKKDMGGAAHALALGHALMSAELPIRLTVLVPAVENSVSGNAFRPMDIIKTRKGLTVEIGNTDAEGRLVLCDALAEACEHPPELLLDFATLTGAARVALGTDLPALFCNDEKLAEGLLASGRSTGDEMWRLPLYQPYAKQLETKTADLNNASSSPFAGAITAALFLERFVSGTSWAHVDLMAWNSDARSGRPKGGEAMTLRAFYNYLRERYAAPETTPAKNRTGAKTGAKTRAKKSA